MKKRVLIIYTGGTIGMKRSANGYVPETGLEKLLAEMNPPDPDLDMPEYVVHECPRLIDSANLHPQDWYRIANLLVDQYDQYDGFVVLHGTDTMAYTASALSFVLQGLAKSVIITGSQIPLWEMRNDARNNLLTALVLAAHHPIPEVSLYFNGRLMRGNRTTKAKAEALDAFDSPNYPPLAKVGIHIEIDRNAILKWDHAERFQLPEQNGDRVAVLKLFPGISANLLARVLEPPLKGVILESYGIGSGPIEYSDFLEVLSAATERGVTVVAVSQCFEGRVDLTRYAVGVALAKAGVISGFDMTTEAAYTKLNHLLAMGLPNAEVRRCMPMNLCGELCAVD